MEKRDWTPRRRIEDDYRKLIYRLLSRYLDLPEASGLGELTAALVNWTNLQNFFEQAATSIASRMATQVQVSNARSWREAARKGSRGREIYQALELEMETGIGQRVREIVAENAQLISSIPAEIREQVNREISSMELQGLRPDSIAEYLRRRIPTLTMNRSNLIARTETSKSSTALTRARSEDLGIPAYVWATSRDARVRPSHRIMDQVIVFWNEPPNPEVLNHEKDVGHGPYHAGNIYYCRCDSYPLLRFEDVAWPHKVYSGGSIKMLTLVGFKRKFSHELIAA